MRVTGVTGVIVVFLLAFRNRYTMYEIKDSDSFRFRSNRDFTCMYPSKACCVVQEAGVDREGIHDCCVVQEAGVDQGLYAEACRTRKRRNSWRVHRE